MDTVLDQHPGQPYLSFLQETLRFQAANLYLLAVQISPVANTDSRILEQFNDLTQRVTPQYEDVRGYFTARLFISHIAAFEIFLQELLSLVIQKHPKKVGTCQFPLQRILDASSTEELVQLAIDDHLNKLMYEKPSEYLKKVCGLLAIDVASIESRWRIFVEAKARRDLGLHNAWKCNAIYLRKLEEAGCTTTLKIGDLSNPKDTEYIQPLIDELDCLANEITNAVIKVHWPDQMSVLPK